MSVAKKEYVRNCFFVSIRSVNKGCLGVYRGAYGVAGGGGDGRGGREVCVCVCVLCLCSVEGVVAMSVVLSSCTES